MGYRDQRYPTDRDVWLEHNGEAELVELADVSSSGAKLLHSRQLPQGTPVTIRCLHLRVSALVVRSTGRQIAVNFLQPLSVTDGATLRGVKGGQTVGWGTAVNHGFRELS
jgi:hypothetical protein